jgi:hypothetical protein
MNKEPKLSVHEFDLTLPLYLNCGADNPNHSHPLKLKIDGQPLKGVKELVVRAGASGFTNVVLELEAVSTLKLLGALIAHLNFETDEQRMNLLGGVFDQAVVDVLDDVEQSNWFDGDEKCQLVQRIVELLIENGDPKSLNSEIK